ncbi:resistance to Congo red protein ASCRUDRAFT_20958, partial [Ascoidea rubescens DSM 1968]
SSSWEWARWLLFILFVILIIFLFFGTRRVNRFRIKKGQTPIRGTAWITPPSYYQSQAQYNQPANGTGAYVPPYTADVNPNDAGYYDNTGVFHPNDEN